MSVFIASSISYSYNPVSSSLVLARAYSDDRQVVPDRLPISDEKALYDRGLKAAEEGKDSEAIDLLTKVISLNSRNVAVYVVRAQVFQKLSQNQEALKDYDAAIKLMNDSKELGLLYGMRGDLYKGSGQIFS